MLSARIMIDVANTERHSFTTGRSQVTEVVTVNDFNVFSSYQILTPALLSRTSVYTFCDFYGALPERLVNIKQRNKTNKAQTKNTGFEFRKALDT